MKRKHEIRESAAVYGEPEGLQRESLATRERLSGPALRAFFALSDKWQLSSADARGLLGWVAESTFYKYKAGDTGTLSYDLLTRISVCLGIYKALHTFFAEPQLADHWIRLPNSNVLFGGRTPLDVMVHGGIDGLYQVRRLLDARLQ